jgi:dTDP-4-dehydrorhamnose 3,5-epimerase-like enzyme
MKIINTKISGLKIIQSKNYYDPRGYFREVFKKNKIKKNFIFGCLSKSKKKCFKRTASSNKIFTSKIYYCIKRKNL